MTHEAEMERDVKDLGKKGFNLMDQAGNIPEEKNGLHGSDGGLRMLSLVLGSEITDASVAAIASSYSKFELLDLSGSSITDSGIGMICNVFPNTLSRLLLALCPKITSSGMQFTAAQLPLLELMDCGMTICDLDSQNSPGNYEPPNALCLSCPELNDLNLNSCKNLHPEKLLLQCPSLRNVHATGCNELLIGSIKSQLSESLASVENHIPLIPTKALKMTKEVLPAGSRTRAEEKKTETAICDQSDEEQVSRRAEKSLCCSRALSFLRGIKHPGSISLNSRTEQRLSGRLCCLGNKQNLVKVKCSQKREIPVLEGSSMHEVFDNLAERILPTSAVASNPNTK
ncbi:F-box/LRR-repeat protein 17 [Hibiscus syriacus]|uniref:F-box/LRR-repeat protein 17 n=1 Tax=Hibiscus syriacus TaxID=106335 RepID=A0A6A2YRA1_HIBSY|nr:F-box/LRR-repeat protein 17 [Hibiscus syriacus]